VLGITSLAQYDDDGEFLIGASIITYNFYKQMSGVTFSDFKDLAITLHPNESTFIKFFRDFISYDDVVKVEEDNEISYETTWEIEGTSTEGDSYHSTETLTVSADSYFSYSHEINWENGDAKTTFLYGYYSSENGLNDFIYDFYYEWNDGDWYFVSSENINYDTDLALTLKFFYSYSSPYYDISDSNIEYAKEQFNIIYKWLSEWIAEYE